MNVTWRIYNIERTLPEGLVIKVTYGCEVKSANFLDRKVGFVDLVGDVSSENFIPYEDLTEEIVINWVKTELGVSVTEIESDIVNRLTIKEDKLTNKTTDRGLPWDQSIQQG